MAIPTGTKINKKEKGLIWQYPPALIISDVVQM
jgi:hypothetical protein